MGRLRLLLYPLGLIYNLITTIRNVLFNLKIKKVHYSGTPVICIGNLSAGGTGKTPHTEFCIRLLSKEFKITVLSRGYNRLTSGYILADKKSNANQIGDEPFQFYNKFPDIKVAVDEKRVRGIRNIIQDHHPDIIILDDAFQHRHVKPHFSILLSDFNHLFTDDFVLPAGNLRENRFNAKRADLVIVTKCPSQLSLGKKKEIIEDIQSYTKAKVLFSKITYCELKTLDESIKVSDFEANKLEHIIAVTGIAKSDGFVKALHKYGEKIRHHKFADHYRYSETDIEDIILRFNNIETTSKAIFTTEKDAMRLLEFKDMLKDIPVYYWPIEIEMSDKDKIVLKKALLGVVNV